MKHIIIINGPNLNLLGKRNPSIYGNRDFESYFDELVTEFDSEALCIQYYQSNHEGDIIDKLQEVGYRYDGVILNAGGYTHTSIAIADCIEAISCPVIEVHISDIKSRESFRHHSYLEPVCRESIVGQGLEGYRIAILSLMK